MGLAGCWIIIDQWVPQVPILGSGKQGTLTENVLKRHGFSPAVD
jgi:hypothetical protein